ncbi:MAG: hypothetical protein HON53_15610 [Planctomycetaceae bacterium]|jgi:hypothetical protein|nr:hypothetical protein [Planctomycetaceae bacterium]MBT6155388.1 hypothetical protein [Planctomycetaceae bacterium]MBT6487619.1 hypothetical protein [Planctomycetaceae bacterium]MBT6495890.1 hypothetical protein [Planctomycetaceae bacterium]
MSVTWEEYLTVPEAKARFIECFQRCRGAFERHRENIRNLVETTSPGIVACLGAGVLNDIPYRTLAKSGAKVHLVDWLAGSSDVGISLSLIEMDDGEQPQCLYCDVSHDSPEEFCLNYRRSNGSADKVCDSFELSQCDPPTCNAFVKGDSPSVHYEDVTGGYANEFGQRLLHEMRDARTWERAFSKATKLAGRIKPTGRLSIDDASVDLVTSSMLVSQFAHEPYNFFAARTAERLGAPTPEHEARLLPAMEKLRSALFTHQVERHLDEIQRILSPGGKCYLSFELFSTIPQSHQWFMVEGVPKALQAAGDRFHFNFDAIPESESIAQFQTRTGRSLTLCVVMESKPIDK